jgi:hypothetical protein
LIYYKRFIDDVFGCWFHDDDTEIDAQEWAAFKMAMNSDSGLEWDISAHAQCVNFMDLTLSIKNNKIHTTLYQKTMNLYLYIPPHSSHPPGVLTGLVLGGIHRIYSLCSDDQDIQTLLQQFYNRLVVRGYKRSTLEPLFAKALERQQEQSNLTPVLNVSNLEKNKVFFHLQYNSGNPKSKVLQQLWREHIVEPPGRLKLPYTKNQHGVPMELNRMTVAYSRCLNLGNLLSYRKLPDDGPPASSYQGLDG